jgi:hypothetical protein
VRRVALLDVNVLVALFDPDHVHHDAVHRWFGAHRASGWATCPLTENGMVRILSNMSYSGSQERPAQVLRRLRTFCASGHHVFWPDEVSLQDSTLYEMEVAAGHRQITDIYLLGLAKRKGGRLATLDRGIPLAPVSGARPEHLAVIPA